MKIAGMLSRRYETSRYELCYRHKPLAMVNVALVAAYGTMEEKAENLPKTKRVVRRARTQKQALICETVEAEGKKAPVMLLASGVPARPNAHASPPCNASVQPPPGMGSLPQPKA